MANAAKLLSDRRVFALVVGYPGSGKTGALSPLIDAGFKIRMMDFDGNPDPLFEYVKDKSKLENVDIVHLDDKLRAGQRFIEPMDVVNNSAFKRGLDLMDQWKYKEADGTEVNLGKSKDWGPDTIVVLDSLTSMGAAAFRRVRALLNKTATNTTQQVWGIAQGEQEDFIRKLKNPDNRFHVIVLSHLVMIGPEDVKEDDKDLTKELKERIAQIVPTRLYPSALGKKLPQNIAQHFPTVLRAQAKYGPGNTVTRRLFLAPTEEVDLKIPAAKIEPILPIETGMLTVFQALSPSSVALVSGR